MILSQYIPMRVAHPDLELHLEVMLKIQQGETVLKKSARRASFRAHTIKSSARKKMSEAACNTSLTSVNVFATHMW